MGDVVAAQQQIDLLEPLAEPRHRLVGRAAEAAEFVRQKGAREADIEPAAAQRIEHRDLAGQLQRVVEDRQHRPGHQPRLARPHRRRRQEHDRVGAVAAVVMKIMLDDADMAVAEPIGLFRQVQRFAEIGFRRFFIRPDVGKELHAELHGGIHSRFRAQRTDRSRTAAPKAACGCDARTLSHFSCCRTQAAFTWYTACQVAARARVSSRHSSNTV